MDTDCLEGIGLSKNEARVFLTLLKIGQSKAGAIISKTGLQSSAVYNAINSLRNKGLVSTIKKTGVKYYQVANPEVILDYLETKKEEYKKILPELKKFATSEIEEVEFFKTIKGIKTLLSEMIKDAKKGDIYRFFAVEDIDEYRFSTEKVYELQKPIRKEKRIRTKGLFSEKLRNLAKAESIDEKRYLNFPLPPNTQIFNNKVAIISWKGEQPTGVLIKSKNIYETYVRFFEYLWERAKE